ncbi:MAG: DUF1330 domain-containing protein [Sphingobium sp.]
MINRKMLCGGLVGAVAAGAAWAAVTPSPKAYVVAEISVTDPEGYKAYVAAVTPVVAKFGGVYLARGGRTVAVEGAPPAGRIVVIQFPSMEAASAFQASPEEEAAMAIRRRASTGRQFIVEGAPVPPA